MKNVKICILLQVGEGRACWSLGNAHSAMGETETAFHYASRHLDIAKETGDRTGQATAQQNLAELGKSLGYSETGGSNKVVPGTPDKGSRRLSMENMQVINVKI